MILFGVCELPWFCLSRFSTLTYSVISFLCKCINLYFCSVFSIVCLELGCGRGRFLSNTTFQRLVRKKKSLYLDKFEEYEYCLFLGRKDKSMENLQLEATLPHLRCSINMQRYTGYQQRSFFKFSGADFFFLLHIGIDVSFILFFL